MKKLHLFLCLLIAGITTGFAQTDTIRFSKGNAWAKIAIYGEPNTEISLIQDNEAPELDTIKNGSVLISIYSDTRSAIIYATQGKISGIRLQWASGSFRLDASNCVNLDSIDLSLEGRVSVLTSLDVTGCSNLKELYCNDQKLTRLDVSTCTSLEKLHCFSDGLGDAPSLTTLNVNGCSKLKELYCYAQKLTTLDVSTCTSLEKLACGYNQLTRLDVSGNTSLTDLSCSGSLYNFVYDSAIGLPFKLGGTIKHLNISGCTNLQNLDCIWNPIEELDASGLKNLKTLEISSTSSYFNQFATAYTLKKLDVTGCTSLETLYCRGLSLTTLDLSGCPSLRELNCANGYIGLSNLNLSGCKNLEKIDCSNNQISSNLDLSNNSNLKEVLCQNNQIGALDLSGSQTFNILIAKTIKYPTVLI